MASGAGAWPLAEEAVEAGPSGRTSAQADARRAAGEAVWTPTRRHWPAAQGCQPRRLQAGLQRRLLLRRQWSAAAAAPAAAEGLCQPRRLQALQAGLQRRLLLRRQRPTAARGLPTLGPPLHAIQCKWAPASAHAWARTATERCMQGNSMSSFYPSSSPATSHTVPGQIHRPEAVSTCGAERRNVWSRT